MRVLDGLFSFALSTAPAPVTAPGANVFAVAATTYLSNPEKIAFIGACTVEFVNGCNQALSVKYQGSTDKVTWEDLDVNVSVAAASGVDVQTMSDVRKYIRVAVTTGGTAPTGGATASAKWTCREGPTI